MARRLLRRLSVDVEYFPTVLDVTCQHAENRHGGRWPLVHGGHKGMVMSGQTTININSYTVEDDVTLSDDFIKIGDGNTVVFLGDDIVSDDYFSGVNGDRVSVRGSVTIAGPFVTSLVSGELSMYSQPGPVVFVNMDTVTETGAIFQLTTEDIETNNARNIAGATWTLEGTSSIYGGLGGGSFTNLGRLVEQAGGSGTISANFIDREGTIEVDGKLTFTDRGGAAEGYPNRFVNDTITGSGELDLIPTALSGYAPPPSTFVNSNISVATLDLADARTVGNTTISSSTVESAALNVAAGATLNFTNPNAQVTLGAVDNNGAIEAFGNSPSTTPVDLVFGGALTGVGVVEIGPENVTLSGSAGPNQTLNFSVGDTSLTPTLILNDAADFASTISGFDKGAGADDKIVLSSTTDAWQFQGYSSSTGALDFTNASGGTAAVHLAGTYAADDFHAVVSGSSTTVTYG